jgi:hypothetical protein
LCKATINLHGTFPFKLSAAGRILIGVELRLMRALTDPSAGLCRRPIKKHERDWKEDSAGDQVSETETLVRHGGPSQSTRYPSV